MLLVNRRLLLGATFLQATSPWNNVPIAEVAQIIKNYCPREFISAVQSAGQFLYRGEDLEGVSYKLLAPEPDLLLAGTYEATGALPYFQSLERQLLRTTDARPSRGHIGTSTISDASIWGSVVSVWPFGTQVSYVYPSERQLIYPGGRDPDKLIIQRNLASALRQGKEILFATSYRSMKSKQGRTCFLAVTQRYDDELKSCLNL